MPDREKVIDGINKILEETDEYDGVLWDALAMLKEQKEHCEKCGTKASETIVELQEEIARLRSLLKEQEQVQPIPYHRSDGTIFKYECRKCRTKIFKGDLFCRHCGNPVLWEGR